MKLIRHPWEWVRRLRHRRGYGVHSPFAFSFLSAVVYERSAYYAYRDLLPLHPWWVRCLRLYPLACCRLLFRLANYSHPQTTRIFSGHPIEAAYIKAAVPSARWVVGTADFIFLPHEQQAEAEALLPQMSSRAMLVLEGIHADRPSALRWQRIQATPCVAVTFDLYTYGIVFFNTRLNKQHYVINF